MNNTVGIHAAFPIEVRPAQAYAEGLTKREIFAAMAMQGLLANSALEIGHEMAAEWAVSATDMLIAELNKESK